MGDTKMRTISYDPAVYKLVPVEPDGDMYQAAGKIDDICFAGGNAHGASDDQIWEAMLAAVPDQLPGVVVHGGEPDPSAFESWAKREGALNLKPACTMYCEDGRFPATYFYAHTETAWRAWANHPALSHPSAEALVQAALEAALDAVQNVEINCDASGVAIGSAERRIRALDKQQIIESCKEKS